MKTCPNCQTQFDDNSLFCPNCGTQQITGQPQPAQLQQPDSSMVLSVVKRVGSSPLFLVAVIALTASIMFAIAGAATLVNNTTALMESLRELAVDMDIWYDVEDVYYEIYNALTDTSVLSLVVAQVIGSLPQILVAIGLWMIYSTSVSSSERMETGGFTLVKVITIIEMVFIDVALFIGIACMAVVTIAMSNISDYGADEDLAALLLGIVIILLVLFVIMAVITNLFYVKSVKSVNTVKKTIQTGAPSDKVSTFVAVILFIEAFFSLGNLISLNGIFGLLQAIATIVYLACLGAVMLKYKNTMRELM